VPDCEQKELTRMTDRPTDSAIIHFKQVHAQVVQGINSFIQNPGPDGSFKVSLLQSIDELGKGLIDLSVGIRAVYILLEEIKRKV
jgi:hypothetical protein